MCLLRRHSARLEEPVDLEGIPCDVVFVDGSHGYSYVVSDSGKALRMVRPGGLVLWHDYSPESAGVFRALNELARRVPLTHIQGTTLVAFRNGAAV